MFAGQLDRAQVVGFQRDVAVGGQLARAAQVGFAFQQRLTAEGDAFAGGGQVAR